MAVTLRFQSTGVVPGSGDPIRMRGASMTIGRSNDNDVVLPDPDRVVSKTHCVIEDHNGHVVVVDLSANGTFLNYGKVPLGNKATPLNSGDVLTLGPYELVVDISKPPLGGEHLAPLAEGPASHGRADRAPDPFALLEDAGPGGDFLDDLLGPDKAPTGPKAFKVEEEDPFDRLLAPLGADEDPFLASDRAPPPSDLTLRDDGASTGDAFRMPRPQANVIPDDWDDLLDLGTDPARPTGPPQGDPFAPPAPPPAAVPGTDPFAPRPAAPPVQTPKPASPVPPAAAAAPAATAVPSAADTDTARAFLRALGAGDVAIPDEELHATLLRLANVLRTMITGIREVLMTRTSIKGEFRIDQTMISSTGNNPLKFSITPEQAIEALAKPSAKGYLPAEQAAEQALTDIKAHEIAMVTGMEAALKGVLKRLDPKLLAEDMDKRGGAGFLSNRKAKYWETYEGMYAEIADQAENHFHDLFAREFAAAYKAQLERLK